MKRYIYAWVGDDVAGVERILMIPETGTGRPFPLVGLNVKHLKLARRHARATAATRHATLRLVRYEESAIVDVIET